MLILVFNKEMSITPNMTRIAKIEGEDLHIF